MTPAVSAPGMTPAPAIVYPESDGKPMADNTRQARWIVVLYDNLKALFADRDDVFVAADLLWYPLEGEPEERVAPDVMVAFGRPRGDRGSYRQWEENDVPATVVFEVLSPANSREEMDDKLVPYEHHGVEEYYLYDPERNTLNIRTRNRWLRRVHPVEGYQSPRLGIRFEMTTPEMTVFKPDGERFLYFEELQAERLRQQRRADTAEDRMNEANKRVRRMAEL